MRINRKKFFDNYRTNYSKLTQPLVDNLNFLLSKLETGTFKLPSQMAYMLATVKHETADTFAPVVEGYWMKSNRVAKLYAYYKAHNRGAIATIFPNGVIDPTFEGRGYVQLTHNFNYDKFGLVDTPEKALEPETAFHIMEYGMANGLFTGKTLQRYVNETQSDFYSARKVINGLDRASLIAGYAKQLQKGIELVADDLAMSGFNQETYS